MEFPGNLESNNVRGNVSREIGRTKKETGGKSNFQSTKSRAGEQFPRLDCRAATRVTFQTEAETIHPEQSTRANKLASGFLGAPWGPLMISLYVLI